MSAKVNDIIKQVPRHVRDIIADLPSHFGLWRTLLILAAITILSFEAVSLFYNLVSMPLISSSSAARNIAQKQETGLVLQRSPLQSYGIIAERNLFASTLQAIGERQLDGGFFVSGQEASAFELKGTVAGGSSFGFAVMEERGKNKQTLYRLGDMVGSARLIKITRNTVVLRGGDRDITLKIKETPEGSLFSRSPGAGIKSSGVSLSRKEVTDKLGDLKDIMSQAAVRPAFVAGVQEGYLISDIKPDSIYKKLGLQNGDIILDVNNKPLRSADDLLQLVGLMQSGANLSVSLKRNGKNETINYSFQ
jgi:general secretion pathway protein C